MIGDNRVYLQVGLYDVLLTGGDSSLSLLVPTDDSEDSSVESALGH